METTKRQKIAVFGGSFDPPHYGHLDIVKNLEKSFDCVFVVPSNISPFKSGADDPKIRLKICKKFFSSQKTVVLGREVKRGGISYSVDTAKYLYNKYKKTGDLSWIIGTEELERLDEWHDIDTLKKLVTFLAVPRPGFTPKKEKLAALKKRGIKIKIAKFIGLDVSSSVIKLDLAFEKPNRFLPGFIDEYVKKYELFNPYKKYVQALYRHDLSEKRLNHTYGVAVRGAELAKLYGANVNDAIVACLLHDIAKNENPESYVGKVDVGGFPLPTVHAPIGAYIAKEEFGVSAEIEHAIRYHATACEDMSLLDEVVYLADKTEAGRTYSEVYLFRFLCEFDKNLAMYAALIAVTEFKGNLPCEHTTRAIKHYEKLCKGKQIPELPKRKAEQQKETPALRLPVVRKSHELGEVQSKSVRLVPDKSVSVVNEKSKSVSVVKEKSKSVMVSLNDGFSFGKKEINRTSSPLDLADAVAKELVLHKAHDVDIIDLGGKTIIADYFVLASATSTTAVKALYGHVEERMTKSFGLDPIKRDLDKEWVALDYGAIIVHIFTDRTREFYNIERLWSDGTNIKRYGD